MSWTDPAGHTFAVGEVLSAATMNTYLQQNSLFLYNYVTHTTVAQLATLGAGWDNGASGSFVDYAGTGAVKVTGFVKQRAGSQLLCRYSADWFTDIAPTAALFGVNVGGSDYPGQRLTANTATNYLQVVGLVLVSVPAGTYDVTLRCKTLSGNKIEADGDAAATLEVVEFGT